MYQDLSLEVPFEGLAGASPIEAGRVRLALAGEAAKIADLEEALQGVRREKDYTFFLDNKVGEWQVWVLEEVGGALSGVLVSSQHPDWGMLGPGVAKNPEGALALLWRALDARRGRTSVVLIPCVESLVVQSLYGWGARNIELHTAQSTGIPPKARGLAFPTFLPESA
ncbi:MAG: hypothetical protein DVB28_001646 [Verrucomicrobia bacterium]|nr:MAG: hypothetical protein DVB28_001646 [Verrucomicrobiota bacterium]